MCVCVYIYIYVYIYVYIYITGPKEREESTQTITVTNSAAYTSYIRLKQLCNIYLLRYVSLTKLATRARFRLPYVSACLPSFTTFEYCPFAAGQHSHTHTHKTYTKAVGLCVMPIIGPKCSIRTLTHTQIEVVGTFWVMPKCGTDRPVFYI